uniref:TOMM precursor leader peptide-binding protein n=1 Tax=Aldersonia kunmingensis TaxID=408066 RepID=UPI000832A265
LLNPSLPLLLRGDGTVQLGWAPETAVLLRPPPKLDGAALVELLRLLDGQHNWPAVVWQAAALDIGPQSASAILAELEAAGLLVRVTDRVGPSAIRVHGRGPLADQICEGLSGTGVRLSHSADGQRAAADAYRWNAELVVLTDDLVIEPRLVAALMRYRIAHLQVRIRDGRGVVGPLVLPGRTSCLRCADLTRCDYDPDWPHLAAQLLGRVGYAKPAAVRATAALALSELDVVLDGSPRAAPAILDATLELDLHNHRLQRRRWRPHPRCGCALPVSEVATATT